MFEQEFEKLQNDSIIADRIQAFANSPQFDDLKKYVIEPLQNSAFQAFKKTPADQMINIIEAQMMSKMLDKFVQVIYSKIEQGAMARKTMIENSEESNHAN